MALPAAHVGTKVELILTCENLTNANTQSKSDLFVVVYLRTSESPVAWKFLGMTEVINKDLNTRIKMDYFFKTRFKTPGARKGRDASPPDCGRTSTCPLACAITSQGR